jgi:hypothetical protein
MSHPLSGYVLRVTLRLGHCRVDGDDPLAMGPEFENFIDRKHVSVSC